MTVERAGEGAGGRRRRWSGPGRVRWVVGGGGAGELGCGGSSAAVERGRVRGVGGGARWSGVEGAGGARRRGGPDLARWDSDRDGGGSRSSVHEIYTNGAPGKSAPLLV